MDKQISDFFPLGELTDDTIFHVKDGTVDMYVTREVLSLGMAQDILVDASTTVKGIVQLEDTITSNSTSRAATANSVKQVADQLAGKLSSSVQVIAGSGLGGGGSLTSDVTLTLGTPSTLSSSTDNTVNATSHTHAVVFPITSVAGKAGVVTLVVDDLTNATTVGKSFLTTPNPSAIRFPRINANNSVSYLTATAFLASLDAEAGGGGGGGTVTEVNVAGNDGVIVIDSPITSSGTITISLGDITPDSVVTGTITAGNLNIANWNTAYTERNQWDGGATGLVAATGRTSLGATTVGSNLFTTANPSAITFPRVNADNTVSYLAAADFRTAIGAGTGAGTGTVTSVAATVPTGLTITGSPITASGTLAITFTAGYSIPTTANQTNWSTAFTQTRQWDGGATGLVAATARTSLGVSPRSVNYTIAGTTYDLTAADDNNYGRTTNASAKSITVRPNSTHVLPTDSVFHFRNAGAGDLTIIAASGVTINAPEGGTLVVKQNGTVSLRKVGTNEYDLMGQVVPA